MQFIRIPPAILLSAVMGLLSGCLDDDTDYSATSSAGEPTQDTSVAGSANAAPSISGTAPKEATVGSAYNFTPSATDPDAENLTFVVRNKPDWASFDAASGRLSGTPTAADVGNYADIVIGVHDGLVTTHLAAFNIAVNQASMGTATLSWEAPTQNEDGSALSTLAGYRVLYGKSAGALTESIKVDNAGLTRLTVENLSADVWYFAVTAFNKDGLESDLSPVISARIG